VVTGRAALGSLGLVVLAASGCFDVHAIDPGPAPFVLDDFDDGDVQPNDPNFDPWECYTINPQGAPNTCTPRLVSDGSPALVLDATIVDPADGLQQHGGAELATYARLPKDVSRFSVIVFNAKLQSGNPPISSDAILSVEIGCRTVPDADGIVPSRLYVSTGVEYGTVWTPSRVSLRNFGWQTWAPPQTDAGPGPCLQKADSVRFSVDAALPDGATGVFHLTVDDITFL